MTEPRPLPVRIAAMEAKVAALAIEVRHLHGCHERMHRENTERLDRLYAEKKEQHKDMEARLDRLEDLAAAMVGVLRFIAWAIGVGGVGGLVTIAGALM